MITSCIPSDHHVIKFKVNSKQISTKRINSRRLRVHYWMRNGSKKKSTYSWNKMQNVNTSEWSPWDTLKVALRGDCTALSDCNKASERALDKLTHSLLPHDETGIFIQPVQDVNAQRNDGNSSMGEGLGLTLWFKYPYWLPYYVAHVISYNQ